MIEGILYVFEIELAAFLSLQWGSILLFLLLLPIFIMNHIITCTMEELALMVSLSGYSNVAKGLAEVVIGSKSEKEWIDDKQTFSLSDKAFDLLSKPQKIEKVRLQSMFTEQEEYCFNLFLEDLKELN